MAEYTRWVVVDDADSRIRYSGSWSTATGNTNQHNNQGNFGQVYLNTLHTTTSSSSLSFTFTGNAADIIGTNDLSVDSSGNSDPSWECVVDGKVDSSAKTKPFRYRENNWYFCKFHNLSSGEHTISVNVKTKGRAFWFDRIHYRPTNVVEDETFLVTRDDADINYSRDGKWTALAQVAYFTHVTGGSVTFPFIGSGISLWAMAPTELPHGASQGEYSIDGGDPVSFTIREVGGISDYNRKIFESPRLSHGRHEIKVTYRSGTKSTPLVVDGFIVSGGTNKRAPALIESSPEPSTPDRPSSGGSGNSGSSGDSDTSNSGGSGSGNGNASQGGNASPGTGSGNSTGGTGSSGQTSQDSPKILPVSDVFPDVSSRVVYSLPTGIDENGDPSPSGLSGSASDGTQGSSSSSTPVGAIVGGILGALALAALAAGTLLFLRRRRRRASSRAGGFNPAYLAAGPYQHPVPPPAMSYSAPSRSHPSIPHNSNHGNSSLGHERTFSDPSSLAVSSYYGGIAQSSANHHSGPDDPPVYRS